jgi:hypothetical protein
MFIFTSGLPVTLSERRWYMASMAATWLPNIGDRVALRGTRIVGDVKRIDDDGGNDRVVLKVTAVVGKSGGSKATRAWRGAWVTCVPELLRPHPAPTVSAN